MANTKISALISGNPAQTNDQIPINRGGSNFSITAGSIAALITGTTNQITVTGSVLSIPSVFIAPGSIAATTTLGVVGATSGTATFTAPAIAGTTTNPISVSNVLLGPAGSAASPTFAIPNSSGAGMFETPGTLLGFSFNGAASMALSTNRIVLGDSIAIWWASTVDSLLDTGISRISNGVVSIDTTTSGNAAGTLRAATVTLGTNGVVGGQLNLNGATSGSANISVSATGGTLNLGVGGVVNIDSGGTLRGATGSFTQFFSGGLFISTAGLIGTYNNISTVSNGVPSEVAVVDLTAQSAAKTATTLYAVPAAGAGMYRISWAAAITTAGTSSVLGGTGGFQALYTSPTDSVVKTTVAGNSTVSAANTTGTSVGGSLVVYAKASTNIQYQFDYTSTGTAMVYELHIKVESL